MRSAPVSTGLTIGPFQSPGLNSDILNGGRISTEGDIAFGIAIGVCRFGFIRIVGDVVLGDGVHTFVFGNGGTLSGNLFLGGGNDLVLIENGQAQPTSLILRPSAKCTSTGDPPPTRSFVPRSPALRREVSKGRASARDAPEGILSASTSLPVAMMRILPSSI